MEELGALIAHINKVQTLSDGGARLTLDLSANDFELVSKLISHKIKSHGLIFIGISKSENMEDYHGNGCT